MTVIVEKFIDNYEAVCNVQNNSVLSSQAVICGTQIPTLLSQSLQAELQQYSLSLNPQKLGVLCVLCGSLCQKNGTVGTATRGVAVCTTARLVAFLAEDAGE